MRLVGVCLIYLLFHTALSQPDSLLAALQNSKPGIQRVDILNQLCSSYRDKDNNLALVFGKRAHAMADSLNYRPGIALALENTGWISYRMGDYTQSLKLSLDALKHNQVLGDSVAMARCFNNIGAIGFEDEHYGQAVQYFKQGFEFSLHLGDTAIAARSLNNLSLAYFRLDSMDSARYFVVRALALDKGRSYRGAFAYRMLGDLAVVEHKYDSALYHFEKCLELARRSENTFLVTSVQVRIGKVHLSGKNYLKAEIVFKKNIEMAESLGYKNELEQSYYGLADCYFAMGSYKTAYIFKAKYIELHDSLRNESQQERLTSLQARHEAEIQESEIKLLNQQNLLNEQTIKSQRVQNYLYVAGIIVLLVIFIFTLRSNKKINIANDRLKEKKMEVEQQARQLRDLNHSKDKLFQLLSHDLRVPVGNVKSVFELITAGHITQDEFKKLSIELKPALDNLYLDLNNLLQWSKSQLSGIQTSPVQFELAPLVEELVARSRDLSVQKNIIISIDVEASLTLYADRDHLTSIMRNFLSNALKFSHDGGKVWVTASPSDDKIHLSVKDEGIGLSKEELDKVMNHLFFTRPGTHRESGTGIGLMIINEFVKANQGTIEVYSKTGEGSQFIVSFPRFEPA